MSVPRYAGVVGGTDNGRQKTRNHGYDVIVGGELLLIARSPSQACHFDQNSNQQAPDATGFAFPLVGCLRKAAWPERLLSKSQDAVALQRIKERDALYD